MKKFLIAGSSLAAVAAAGSAGAVDITLGGSIDMGVEFGVGKNNSGLGIGDAYNGVTLSLAAAGTTDAGLRYGASFSLATSAELEFSAYDDDGDKHLVKMTVAGATDLEAAAYNVSGGKAIDAKEIVGVKINSDWMSVGATETDYALPLAAVSADDVCKVAGIGAGNYNRGLVNASGVARRRGGDLLNADGDIVEDDQQGRMPTTREMAVRRSSVSGELGDAIALGDAGSYLPAGRVTARDRRGQWNFKVTAATGAGKANVFVHNIAANGPSVPGEDDRFFVGIGQIDNPDGTTAIDDVFKPGVEGVSNAIVYAGPFMEVKLQSSSTKMVVGAVCVEGVDASATNYFMDVASKVLTASDATVYIEGGFGKITVQTSDFAGGVSAIGSAGDEADLSVDGLGVIVTGVGMLGANPYVAVDLAPSSATNLESLSNLEILTGGTIELGGLSAAVDVLINSEDITTIKSWDLGLDYSMGDMALSFAYDDENDWGLSASMAIAGFAVDATFASDDADDHEKTGITYSVAASTSLNGFGLSLGVDQDLKPTVGLSKSMGGLSIYAGYDAADEGGKVGATLSF